MTSHFATEAHANQHQERLLAEAQQHRLLRGARQDRPCSASVASPRPRPFLRLFRDLTPAR